MKSPVISQSTTSVVTASNIDPNATERFDTEKKKAIVNLTKKFEKVNDIEGYSAKDSFVRLKIFENEAETDVKSSTESEFSICIKMLETIDSPESKMFELPFPPEVPQSIQKLNEANVIRSGETQFTIHQKNECPTDSWFEGRTEQKECIYLEGSPNTSSVLLNNEVEVATTPVEESQHEKPETSIDTYLKQPFSQKEANVLPQTQTKLDLSTVALNEELSTRSILDKEKGIDSASEPSSKDKSNLEETKVWSYCNQNQKYHNSKEVNHSQLKHHSPQAADEELHVKEEHETQIRASQIEAVLTGKKTPSEIRTAEVSSLIQHKNIDFPMKSDILAEVVKIRIGVEDLSPESFFDTESQDKPSEQQEPIQMKGGARLESTTKSQSASSIIFHSLTESEKILRAQKDDKATVEKPRKSELSTIAKTKDLTPDSSVIKTPIQENIKEKILSKFEQSTKIEKQCYELPSDGDFRSHTESNSDETTNEQPVQFKVTAEVVEMRIGSENLSPDTFVETESSKSVKALETDSQDTPSEPKEPVQMKEEARVESTTKSQLARGIIFHSLNESEKISHAQKDDKTIVEFPTKSELSTIDKTKELTPDSSAIKTPIEENIDEKILPTFEQSTKIEKQCYKLPDSDFSTQTESKSDAITNEQPVKTELTTEPNIDPSIIPFEKESNAMKTNKIQDELSEEIELPTNAENDPSINFTDEVTFATVKFLTPEQLTTIAETELSSEYIEPQGHPRDINKLSLSSVSKSELTTNLNAQVPYDSLQLESYSHTEKDTPQSSGEVEASRKLKIHQPIHTSNEKIYTDECKEECLENIKEKKFSASSEILTPIDSPGTESITRTEEKRFESFIESESTTDIKGNNFNDSCIEPRETDDAALADVSTKPELSIQTESPHLEVESMKRIMTTTQLQLATTTPTVTSLKSNTKTYEEIETSCLDSKMSDISTPQSSFVAPKTSKPLLDEKSSEIPIESKTLNEFSIEPSLLECTSQFPTKNIDRGQFHEKNWIPVLKNSEKSELDTNIERELIIHDVKQNVLEKEDDSAKSIVTQNLFSDTETQIPLSVEKSIPHEDYSIYVESPTSEHFATNAKSNIKTDSLLFDAFEEELNPQKKVPQVPIEYFATKSELNANIDTYLVEDASFVEINAQSLSESSEIIECSMNTSHAKSSTEKEHAPIKTEMENNFSLEVNEKKTPTQEQNETICKLAINSGISSTTNSPTDSFVRDENLIESVKLIEKLPITSNIAKGTIGKSVLNSTEEEPVIPKERKGIEELITHSDPTIVKQLFPASAVKSSLPQEKLSIEVQQKSLESELLPNEKTLLSLEADKQFSILKEKEILPKPCETSTSPGLVHAPTDTFVEKPLHLESEIDIGELSRESDIKTYMKRDSDVQVVLFSDEHQTDAEKNEELMKSKNYSSSLTNSDTKITSPVENFSFGDKNASSIDTPEISEFSSRKNTNSATDSSEQTKIGIILDFKGKSELLNSSFTYSQTDSHMQKENLKEPVKDDKSERLLVISKENVPLVKSLDSPKLYETALLVQEKIDSTEDVVMISVISKKAETSTQEQNVLKGLEYETDSNTHSLVESFKNQTLILEENEASAEYLTKSNLPYIMPKPTDLFEQQMQLI
ncbi:hypothetical protein WA026_020669 [Henosepilachna vigintioctopunctata]|uniref:Uncharacterized protein n=1 Tax=Henosepilachna vigintioctopunctata TaxID=420089 RepID=A0AAW1UDR0_9CUCU